MTCVLKSGRTVLILMFYLVTAQASTALLDTNNDGIPVTGERNAHYSPPRSMELCGGRAGTRDMANDSSFFFWRNVCSRSVLYSVSSYGQGWRYAHQLVMHNAKRTRSQKLDRQHEG